MIDVLLRCFAEHDYIIEINEGELSFNAEHDHFRGTLEYAGCLAESKRHTDESIGIMVGFECHFIFVFINIDFSISAISF